MSFKILKYIQQAKKAAQLDSEEGNFTANSGIVALWNALTFKEKAGIVFSRHSQDQDVEHQMELIGEGLYHLVQLSNYSPRTEISQESGLQKLVNPSGMFAKAAGEIIAISPYVQGDYDPAIRSAFRSIVEEAPSISRRDHPFRPYMDALLLRNSTAFAESYAKLVEKCTTDESVIWTVNKAFSDIRSLQEIMRITGKWDSATSLKEVFCADVKDIYLQAVLNVTPEDSYRINIGRDRLPVDMVREDFFAFGAHAFQDRNGKDITWQTVRDNYASKIVYKR
jgi:hypothetical protein